jgi:hypothetical protein
VWAVQAKYSQAGSMSECRLTWAGRQPERQGNGQPGRRASRQAVATATADGSREGQQQLHNQTHLMPTRLVTCCVVE